MTTVTTVLSVDSYTAMGDYNVIYDELVIKGGTSLNLNLLGIDESRVKVKTLIINWGDGTIETHKANIFLDYYNESIIPEVRYNKGGSVCLEYSHVYNPTNAAYFTQYDVIIDVLYYNDVQGRFIRPVKVAKSSLYDRVGEIKILNTQSLPLSTSNTLLNLQTEKEFYVIPVITQGS